MPEPVTISAAVEGHLDDAVARKLIQAVGAEPGTVYGKRGKHGLKHKIGAYNNAARHGPWLVLVDLDHDADCAPPIRDSWVPKSSRYLCFRVVVREIESWLLADCEQLAKFLGVRPQRIPDRPEVLDDPKTTLIELARKSSRRDIRQDLVPRPGSDRSVGPAYSSRLTEFVEKDWRPEVAAHRADSLDRAMRCLRRLMEEFLDPQRM
jgi:hypothetical protein